MKNNGVIASGVIAALLTVFCFTFLSTCFTDWDGGYGGVSVNPNGLSVAGDPSWLASKESHKYTVILKHSDGKVYKSYGPLSYDDFVSLRVPPGTWDIELWVDGIDWTEMMKGAGKNVTVKAGIMNIATINMENPPAMEKFEREFARAESGSTIPVGEPLGEIKKDIPLRGKGSGVTVLVTAPLNGPLFKVGNGGKLTLENVTLDGNGKQNNTALVEVDRGSLVMGAGSTIKGNESNYIGSPNNDENKQGGGVRVTGTGASFTMNDGATISYNKAQDGAGVKVNNGAVFTMNGGTIAHNETFSTGTAGGVHVWNAYFHMRGGTIAANTAQKHGGGVYIGGDVGDPGYKLGYFDKTGGTIYGNNAGDNNNNVTVGENGHRAYAVYAGRTSPQWCDSTVTGILSYDGNNGSPIFSDNWESH